MHSNMRIWVRGAGDIATGVAYRLHRCGFSIYMTDLVQPTSIRRTICFSEAICSGEARVEGVTARYAQDIAAAEDILLHGDIAVLADETGDVAKRMKPDALVDAILAKRNVGTRMDDAPIVVALGPGFTAGVDCHAVVETMRGHTLGRVYYQGTALPNTGVPGEIGGFSLERILRAPCDGVFAGIKRIGARVEKGETVAYVDGTPMKTRISGVLRGLLADGVVVTKGMKSGDVDPRCESAHCYLISDKALAVAGGVLEAILHLQGGNG